MKSKFNALAFALAIILSLVACGGGGGGAGSGTNTSATSTSNTDSSGNPPANDMALGTAQPVSGGLLPSMVKGKFANDNSQYVVVAGWLATGPNGGPASPDAPVKIFKLNSDGTGSDVTVSILGSEQSASTNVPVVADFNGDGIDDIFLAGFRDFPVYDTSSVVFLSRAGQSHQRINLPELVWSHAAYAIDIDGINGIDVINSNGQMWLNDGRGNFTFRNHSWDINTSNGIWMHGSGVCAGDFNNTGRNQIVITDQSVDGQGGPIPDTVIFELNNNLVPTTAHYLPKPIIDRNSVTEGSHEVACRVSDLNQDGKLDIVVYSRPSDSIRNGAWTNEGQVQILINQGNWNFVDTTDQALVGYPTNVLVSYSGVIEDLNGDTKPDLWMGYFDATSGKANQAWLNDGNAIFRRSLQETIDSFGSNGPMLPVQFAGWHFVYSKKNGSGYDFFLSKNAYTFQ